MTLKSDVTAIARLAGHPDAPRPAHDAGRLPASGSYPLRARWATELSYHRLRNAAWLVRNSRERSASNPIALLTVVQEVEHLAAGGEPMFDIVEALCELLRQK